MEHAVRNTTASAMPAETKYPIGISAMPMSPDINRVRLPRVSVSHPTKGLDTMEATLNRAVASPMVIASPPKEVTKKGKVGSNEWKLTKMKRFTRQILRKEPVHNLGCSVVLSICSLFESRQKNSVLSRDPTGFT